MWVWNLVSHIKWKTQAEVIWKYGVEEDIWAYKRGSNMRLEKTTYCGALYDVHLITYYSGDRITEKWMGE
jgi:hypothetical protein